MFDFKEFLAKYKGGISEDEGRALVRYAATTGTGDIVEIGSYRGKSAVALAEGLKLNGDVKKRIFCIEPHAEFVGVYGGVFGAHDRADFYQIMLQSDAYRRVALVNLPSAAAARSWSSSIGLLFVDGDHTLEGVRTDAAAWEPFVVPGGIVAFDDSLDPQIGPYHVIEALLGSGRFELAEKVGKISFLRKLASTPVQQTEPKAAAPLRILVVCNDIVVAGGLFRFERTAKVLRQLGHELCFATFSRNPMPAWQSECPIMDVAEAAGQKWDATMVPGAGFPEATIQQFSLLQDANFGYRIQHVLNDQTRRERFIAVNRHFRPDLVLFNNRHWPAGSFTDFSGRRFGVLEGAVDTRNFAPSPYRSLPGTKDKIVLGGLANKNPEPIISSLRLLPNHFKAKLFGNYRGDTEAISDLLQTGRLELVGRLDDATLPSFYESVDIVVHTEQFAGWANLAAEAAASGIPVICTEHGTGAFAVHKKSAYVLSRATAETVADAVLTICSNPDATSAMVRNARERILKYDWTGYSLALADLCRDDGKSHYTWAPQFGLFGKWPLEDRRKDLNYIFANCAGATVIDFGCAEGLIARGLLERGARLVHGFEVDCGRVATAQEICSQWLGSVSFRYANLNEWEQRRDHHSHLLPTYDIVLYLGIHHHLAANGRMAVLADALSRASKMFAIRTTDEMYSTDSVDAFIRKCGFSEVALERGLQPEGMGHVKIYLKD